MPMNPNFLCCIGAELKNSTQQTTRMSQIYFYRAFEEETVADMLQPGFFDAAMGIVRKDDLLLLYDPKDESARWTYCRVSNVDRDGVEISLMGINAKDVLVEIPGEDPITLQSLIDNTIMPAIENIGDMDLPVITEGGTAPTNLSEAIRQIVTQDLTLTEDSVEPESGQFSLWGAIKKALGNAKNFFSSISDLDTRLNALEGQGGPVGSYDFGKSFPNILDATDTQLVAGVMVDNIWAGHTPIVWTTPIANSTFTDGDGVDRTVGEIFNGTWIINSYDGTRIVLTNTPNTTPPIFSYQNVGVYSVGFANATTAGVVRVGTGSDMTVDQLTGDISIDDTKGYSIFHRLISLFTGTQKTQIREDLNAASRDMDDLSATGQNIANWSSNVSNCITEIPNDIKLELNNGTLILKSGSKLYQPDGAGTFTPITISGDKQRNDFSLFASGTYLIFRSTGQYTGNGGIIASRLDNCVSGATDPISGSNHLWYDTTNNVIKTYESGTYKYTDLSLPIAVVTIVYNTGVTSIDQVFNGFGYIGSTVFALPGVKGLIPNGRNSDGTLKNNKITVNSVITKTYTDNNTTGIYAGITLSGTIELNGQRTYNVAENFIYNSSDLDLVCEFAKYINPSGKIANFTPKTAFHAVDYNDAEYIAKQAMPSEKKIDLTIPGSSGASFVAQADGYMFAVATTGGTGNLAWAHQNGSTLTSSVWYNASGWTVYCYIPVRKYDTVKLYWSASTITAVKFIYANGSK